MSLHVAGRTDVGLVREHNEDNFVVIDLDRDEQALAAEARRIEVGSRGTLLLVCDGMGGAAAGEVASQMAVETMFEILAAPADVLGDAELRIANFARRIRVAALAANERIYAASRADQARAGMGTTMTAVGLLDDQMIMGQVGDSRAYVLRGERLVQVTRDQSLVNQLLEMGQITEEQAKLFEHSNVILQALGVQPDVEVLLSRVHLRDGDRMIVCTDGLTGVVTDEELATVVGATDDTAEACRLLIDLARAAGGPDNITVIVARCEGLQITASAAADAAVTYQRWRLDESSEPSEPSEPPREPESELPEEPLPEPAGAHLFLSMMLLLALTIAGAIAATLLRQVSARGTCTVESRSDGWALRVDGRDTGVRTRAGAMEVSLPPGRHRLSLRSRGAALEDQLVEVTAGAASCRATFAGGTP